MPGLCLTRRVGDVIRIGPDITIHIRKCDQGQCRLSIDAPRDVLILRGELPVPPPAETAATAWGNITIGGDDVRS